MNENAQTAFKSLFDELGRHILGQNHLLERLLIALLADGHLLVEGSPGLAKTRAIKTLAKLIDGEFQRIQFTPDLLPSDITGADVYRPDKNSFDFLPGPLFHNLVLADEINRAPAKVQSALLEAMGERQVSVGQRTLVLPELFLVMATQNPLEQEGTYPLPEAQLDRFLMHVLIDYPESEFETAILELSRSELSDKPTANSAASISAGTIFSAREEIMQLHMSPPVQEYLVQLVLATRHPERYDARVAELIDFGVSPRATIALDRCARARAWLAGCDFVSPDDVQSVLHDCLRHRIILSLAAEAQGRNADSVLNELLDLVPVT